MLVSVLWTLSMHSRQTNNYSVNQRRTWQAASQSLPAVCIMEFAISRTSASTGWRHLSNARHLIGCKLRCETDVQQDMGILHGFRRLAVQKPASVVFPSSSNYLWWSSYINPYKLLTQEWAFAITATRPSQVSCFSNLQHKCVIHIMW